MDGASQERHWKSNTFNSDKGIYETFPFEQIMRRNAKVGVAIVLILLFAPVVPFAYPKSLILPWSSQCYGVPYIPRALVFASLSFILFQKGVALVPQSNSPIQFQPSFLPSGKVCG